MPLIRGSQGGGNHLASFPVLEVGSHQAKGGERCEDAPNILWETQQIES